MRKPILTALIAGALSAAPIVAFGQTSTSTAKAPAAKQSSTATTSSASQSATKSEATTHSTRGVVKSINDSTLVITRNGKKAGDMTLALNSSTHRDGTIAVGTPVSVRYLHEGKDYVATAITAQAKAPAAQAKPSASTTSTSSAPKK
ncbi:MAG TPA: hypothetical protein VH417_01400 [Vicinamibacterales bacterium]